MKKIFGYVFLLLGALFTISLLADFIEKIPFLLAMLTDNNHQNDIAVAVRLFVYAIFVAIIFIFFKLGIKRIKQPRFNASSNALDEDFLNRPDTRK